MAITRNIKHLSEEEVDATLHSTDMVKGFKINISQKAYVGNAGGDTIVVDKDSKNRTKEKPATVEFEKWIKRVFDEDGEALDELATR